MDRRIGFVIEERLDPGETSPVYMLWERIKRGWFHNFRRFIGTFNTEQDARKCMNELRNAKVNTLYFDVEGRREYDAW